MHSQLVAFYNSIVMWSRYGHHKVWIAVFLLAVIVDSSLSRYKSEAFRKTQFWPLKQHHFERFFWGKVEISLLLFRIFNISVLFLCFQKKLKQQWLLFNYRYFFFVFSTYTCVVYVCVCLAFQHPFHTFQKTKREWRNLMESCWTEIEQFYKHRLGSKIAVIPPSQ